jgi:hypothetical protein
MRGEGAGEGEGFGSGKKNASTVRKSAGLVQLQVLFFISLNPVFSFKSPRHRDAEGLWPEAKYKRSFDFNRSNQIETTLPYQPKQVVFLRILLGHN